MSDAHSDYLARLAGRYDLANSPDWQVLLRHFDLSEGFAFVVLLVPNDDGAEVCRAALDGYLHESGKNLLSVPIPDSGALQNIAVTLLALEPETNTGAIWVARAIPEGVAEYSLWSHAWREALTKLNQYRNPLRRQFAMPVVFCGAPWLQTVLRENAPDLWSIRTVVVRIEPTAAPGISRPQLQPLHETRPDPALASAEANRLRGHRAKK